MATLANALFKFGTAASEIDLTAYVNSVDLSRTADELESTAFGATNKAFSPGLKEAEISFEGIWDATTMTGLEALLGVADKNVIFAPNNVAGQPKYSCTAFLKELPISSAVGELLPMSGSIRLSGLITIGTV